MEAVGLSTCALPPVDFTAQSFYKVTSAILDPSKHWYLLLKEVCGVPLRNFSYAMYLRYFRRNPKCRRAGTSARQIIVWSSGDGQDSRRRSRCVHVRSSYWSSSQ